MKKIAKLKLKVNTVSTTTEIETVSQERKIATVSLCPLMLNARTAIGFSTGLFGEPDIAESMVVLRDKVRQIQAGDLSEIEATLAAQAITLNSIFNEMARRAAANMGQNLQLTESYLRMALKAQAQSRATMETLAEVKYPKAPTFVKQQNNAYQQQVNNPNAIEGDLDSQNSPIDYKRAHGNK
jgi:hypothetical protein